jgi:hypothetical protein
MRSISSATGCRSARLKHVDPAPPARVFRAQSEHARRGRIDGRHRAGRIERHDAGGDVLEDALDVAVTLGQLAVDRLEIARHAIERRDERADLLVAAGGGTVVPVTLGDFPHALAEALNRHRDALGEVEPEPRGREQHDESDQQEGDRVAAANGLLEDLELAVLVDRLRGAPGRQGDVLGNRARDHDGGEDGALRVASRNSADDDVAAPSRSVRAKSCPCAKSARSSPRGNGTPRAAMRSPVGGRHRTGGADDVDSVDPQVVALGREQGVELGAARRSEQAATLDLARDPIADHQRVVGGLLVVAVRDVESAGQRRLHPQAEPVLDDAGEEALRDDEEQDGRNQRQAGERHHQPGA